MVLALLLLTFSDLFLSDGRLDLAALDAGLGAAAADGRGLDGAALGGGGEHLRAQRRREVVARAAGAAAGPESSMGRGARKKGAVREDREGATTQEEQKRGECGQTFWRFNAFNKV